MPLTASIARWMPQESDCDATFEDGLKMLEALADVEEDGWIAAE